MAARDALSRSIYSHIFDWLIMEINVALEASKKGKEENLIGVLDIFGFEIFEENSFEQLCINFTNEKLQNHFMDALVVLRQKEYAAEGIECKHITFPDNLKQIELIENKARRTPAARPLHAVTPSPQTVTRRLDLVAGRAAGDA